MFSYGYVILYRCSPCQIKEVDGRTKSGHGWGGARGCVFPPVGLIRDDGFRPSRLARYNASSARASTGSIGASAAAWIAKPRLTVIGIRWAPGFRRHARATVARRDQRLLI